MDESKIVAKEIILAMIEKDMLIPSEWPEAETTVDMLGQAYQRIMGYIVCNK